jgi:hypothetical protein
MTFGSFNNTSINSYINSCRLAGVFVYDYR